MGGSVEGVKILEADPIALGCCTLCGLMFCESEEELLAELVDVPGVMCDGICVTVGKVPPAVV
jgi:hypothetical protein